MKQYVKTFESFIGTNKEFKDSEAFKSVIDNSDKLKTDKRDARIEKSEEDTIGKNTAKVNENKLSGYEQLDAIRDLLKKDFVSDEVFDYKEEEKCKAFIAKRKAKSQFVYDGGEGSDTYVLYVTKRKLTPSELKKLNLKTAKC